MECIILSQREWMIHPGQFGSVLLARLIQVTFVWEVWERLARLRSEGKGRSFLGVQEVSKRSTFFPRIGMGWSGVRRLNPRNWFPEAWGLPPVSQSDRREGTLVPLFLIYCMLLCAQHRRALPSTHDNLPSPSSPLTPSPRGISLEPQG